MSEVLKILEAADALLLLSGSTIDPSISDGGSPGVILPHFSRDRLLSNLLDDNNGGVTRLSAHLVTRFFPANQRGSSSIVYQQRRRVFIPAEVPIGVAGDGEENVTLGLLIPTPCLSMVRSSILCMGC
ncbi:hypothetical protein Hanom_Chr15g01371871 [Helianthus anomalus]